MNFNSHSNLEGQHAILSASKYYWLNYSEEKIAEYYLDSLANQKGTVLHDFAKQCILLKQRLPKSDKKTLNMYVNDAISIGMTPEQILYYSDNCFGTADTISFRNNMLHIHDLKTGVKNKGDMRQLLIYSALFCLEYHKDPKKIKTELRIYQYDEIVCHNPEAEEIIDIMTKIKKFDSIISDIKEKEYYDTGFYRL